MLHDFYDQKETCIFTEIACSMSIYHQDNDSTFTLWTYFIGETTSKQNLRSTSTAGLTVQRRKSSSMTVTSSPAKEQLVSGLNYYTSNNQHQSTQISSISWRHCK